MKKGDTVHHDKFGSGFIKDVNAHYVTIFFENQAKAILLDRQTAEQHMTVTDKVAKEEVRRHEVPASPIDTAEGEDDVLDEETAEELAPAVAQIVEQQRLCKCGRPFKHRGRCKGSAAVGGRRTVSEEVSHRETRISRRMEETLPEHRPSNEALIMEKISDLVTSANVVMQSQIAEIRDQVKFLSGHATSKEFTFWSGSELDSTDIDSGETAMLFGARVPATLLDAIWYSMTAQSKARLLSALEVARYKMTPEDERRS